jgi:3-dehydrotetronate 4-kinase
MLGCIADDFTGATDLANNLTRAGFRVMLTIGAPTADVLIEGDIDAVVVALKSRTIPSADAVMQSLTALAALQQIGVDRLYFKYCSTFDSTPRGNIGPVTEALMHALGCDFTVAVPAFLETGRTVFNGHLFVGETLLSESGMRDHPLTPMTDANLVRVLQAQCTRRVGLISHREVLAGPAAIRARIAALRAQDIGLAIVDVLRDADLTAIADATIDLPLLTGGSGLALGLRPPNARIGAPTLPPARGYRAVIAGSCSRATQQQVQRFIDAGHAAFKLDPARLDAAGALAWARAHLPGGPVLIYSTGDAASVRATQAALGVGAGEHIESVLADIAVGLVASGVGQLVVAGGETSGACVRALGADALRIGAQIDPGVPWCFAHTPTGGLHIALKSGNFGQADFFTRAFDAIAPKIV